MKNILDTIKKDDIVSIHLETSAISGKPMLCVDTYSEGEVQHFIDTGIQIHLCNEFLRSLNLVEAEFIYFRTYEEYDSTITFINKLLEIKSYAEQVTERNYDDIGLLAFEIYAYILNTLLSKHRMAKKGWDKAMQLKPLKEWVSEAIGDLTKKCIKNKAMNLGFYLYRKNANGIHQSRRFL